MKPTVSVIIPNYNHATFLKDRLESIINQTYTNFEIIILDDASTDHSNIIIEEHRTNQRVGQILFNTENSGSPFLQWKKGIKLAQGKYIWIAESDDLIKLSFLETLVPFLEKNPNVNLVYADSERNALEWKKDFLNNSIEIQIFEGKEFVQKEMLTSPVIVNASAVLFRRNAVQDNILQQSCNYKTAFDWLFWCDLVIQGKVAFYPAKLNFFRQHLQSTSLNTTRQGLFVIEGLQVISFLKKNYKINLSLAQIKTWSSLWAQTYLLLGSKRSMLLQSRKQAWAVSPKLSIFFVYYLIKFRFFSPTNIRI